MVHLLSQPPAMLLEPCRRPDQEDFQRAALACDTLRARCLRSYAYGVTEEAGSNLAAAAGRLRALHLYT
jgi:hypothetical protein